MNEDQSWLYRRMGGKDCKVCNPPVAELNKETNSRLDELLNAVESYREKMGVPTDTQWRVKFDNFMKDEPNTPNTCLLYTSDAADICSV